MNNLDLNTIRDRLRKFVNERDWNQFHNPKNLAIALSVESSELLELFQWLTDAESQELDKEKQREAQRKWAQNNKIPTIKKRERNAKVRLKKQIWFKKYKKQFSCKCGESDPRCIDFHHVRGKFKEVGVMVSQGYSNKRIIEEIEKCDSICSNCHRKLTFKL